MSYKHFRNAKAARRYLPQVLLNIFAVHNRLKPSYLWDTFDADAHEIISYLQDLSVSHKISNDLTVLTIETTLFIINLEIIQQQFKQLLSNLNVHIIDVSKHHDVPFLLSLGERTKILKNVVDSFYQYLSQNDPVVSNCSEKSLCNLTTLFGAILGYPILYWYNHSDAYDDTCLAMVPLKVHQVLASVKQTERVHAHSTSKPHELYSFSVPDMYSSSMEFIVHQWMNKLKENENGDCPFENIHLVSHVVTLPVVTL